MSWVSKSFLAYLLVLVLLPAIYATFGWYTSEHIPAWSHGVGEIIKRMEISLAEETLNWIGYGLAIALILFVNLSLTLMTKPITWLFSSWFKSDIRAIFSVLGWSFAVVVIFRWIEFFAHFLVLLCITILACLELQEKGYNNQWVIFLILTVICLAGFGAGVWLFTGYHESLNSVPESYGHFYRLT